MKINLIINRYIFIEFIFPFVLNLVFFTFIFLMTKILDITQMIINYNVGVGTVLRMIVYFVPNFLVYVIPIAVMASVLLAFLRMSGDNEIIALRAGGVGIFGLLPPVVLFSLIGVVLTFWVSAYGMPWGRMALEKLTYQVAVSNLELGLKERTFTDSFNGVTIYVNEIDPSTKELRDVFIEDRRIKHIVSTIVAPRAILQSEPNRLVVRARLFDGTWNQADLKDRTVNSIKFGTYELQMDLKLAATPTAPGKKRKHRKEMSLTELRNYIRNAKQKDSSYYSRLITYHNKFAIPLSCLFLGLLAVPLGILSSGLKKSFGLGLGMLFLFVYYIVMSAGKVFGETGLYPPVIGMWAPNLVILIITAYFFYRSADNRTFKFISLRKLWQGQYPEK